MKIDNVYIVIFIILLEILVGCRESTHNGAITVAFYNCENFFDTVHNSGVDDLEFTPAGKYHYTQKIYEQKLHNIATVIQNMDANEGPAIIGLAEVENDAVLTALVNQPEIASRKYQFIITRGPDPRGINVAMLYNPAYFKVVKTETLPVNLAGTEGKTVTRDVLHVSGILCQDTMDIFVNHWPSRAGGSEETAPKRAIAAHVVRSAADKIKAMNPNAKTIIMGDFNDNPDDSDLTQILETKSTVSVVTDTSFFNPWVRILDSGTGTEIYQNTWNLFDQVIISGALVQNKNHKLQYEKAAVFKPDFIVDHYKGHEGEPHRSFVGTHWINGYSDHFPVIIYLK